MAAELPETDLLRELGKSSGVPGTVVLVLHAHLPYVRSPALQHSLGDHSPGTHSLEESWLFEAVADCYLPLLDVLERLSGEGLPLRLTLSLSPTLVSMWGDELLRQRCARYLEARCQLGERELRRTASDPALLALAHFHLNRFERCRSWYDLRFGRDLAGAFRRLAEGATLELITTSATHAFLPLLHDPEAVRAQIGVGLDQHRAVFGHAPAGFWLPECGYSAGLDERLAEHGIRYTFLDTHGLIQAHPSPRFACYAPILSEAGVAIFARDPEASEQVWSAELGYPGDPSYREFHRDIGFELGPEHLGAALRPGGRPGFTGFKYQRVTGGEPKELYHRGRALAQAAEHGRDFARRRVAQIGVLAERMGHSPVVVAPYDAELFGHWWFEGPEFLEAALRELIAGGVRLRTPGDLLREEPLLQVAAPAPSSWGKGGDERTWRNQRNGWVAAELNRAAAEMIDLVTRLEPARCQGIEVRQAARELLLAQASDWSFMIAHQTFAAYAEARVREHLASFREIADGLRRSAAMGKVVAGSWARAPLFPDLDAGLFRRLAPITPDG